MKALTTVIRSVWNDRALWDMALANHLPSDLERAFHGEGWYEARHDEAVAFLTEQFGPRP